MTLKIFDFKNECLEPLENFFFMNGILYKIFYKSSELQEIYYIAADLDNIAVVQWLDGLIQIICNGNMYVLTPGSSCKEVVIDDKDF